MRLWWLAEQPFAARYKVSVQLLDARNQVIAQHDGEPGGGALPTDAWTPGERIADNHSIAIPFGARTGAVPLDARRVRRRHGGEHPGPFGQGVAAIGAVAVERAATTPPLDVAPMQQRVDAALGPVRLAGYDLYRRGFAHAPETPLQPGDTLHLTLYWQAPDPLPAAWPADLSPDAAAGQPAGSRRRWPGAPIRRRSGRQASWCGEFDLLYDGWESTPTNDRGRQRRVRSGHAAHAVSRVGLL